MAWFEASTPVLDQLGATIGRGVTPAGGTTQSTAAQQRDLENMLREQKRQADRAYKQKQSEIDQNYKIAKLNAKTARERNEIDRWYNEQNIANAQARLAQEQRQFDLRLQFDKDRAAEQLGLNQAKLGYDLLGMQAQLRGPENYFQAAEYARGVAAQPGTATFLNALRNNTNLAAYGAQAGVPDRATVNALSARVGGPQIIPGTNATTSASTNDDDNLGAIRGLYAAGAHKLGAGSLEQLTDTEMKLLQSGIDASGGDVATFMDQYRRSRIGNSGDYRAA